MNPFIKDNNVMPIVSLNKLCIGSLKDIALPKYVQGKTGMDLVSGAFFNSQVDKLLEELNMPRYGIARYDLFKKLIAADDEYLNSKADKVIEKLAENLAYLLSALKFSDGANKSLRMEWQKEHWEYWQSIEDIYLSGGLTLGVMGKKLKKYTEGTFEQIGIKPFNLKLTEYGEYLPLIGACNYGLERGKNVLVFDFGHTYVKRGFVQDGTILVLDSIPTLNNMEESYGEQERGNAVLLHSFITDIISDTFKEVKDMGYAPYNIVISIANYINKGSIYLNRGVYGKLGLLGGKYQDYLNSELCSRLSKPVSACLMHDGTAAAAAINDDKAVVITLGTGIGVGFCSMYKLPDRKYTVKNK